MCNPFWSYRVLQEFNYAAVLGLGAAVDYAMTIGLEKISTRVRLKVAQRTPQSIS